MLQPLRFVGGSGGEASGQQQWQEYQQGADGQLMAPPQQPQKRKPGRPRGGAKWRHAQLQSILATITGESSACSQSSVGNSREGASNKGPGCHFGKVAACSPMISAPRFWLLYVDDDPPCSTSI